ncbi:hypothetical protein GJAV_G00187830 [Gymnothorax javanicus]|nr:hypothetical protein GJAV_G00187830 [Gymnothorax javanicus]
MSFASTAAVPHVSVLHILSGSPPGTPHLAPCDPYSPPSCLALPCSSQRMRRMKFLFAGFASTQPRGACWS